MPRTFAERERSFSALAENSPDIIIRYDRDLGILYANPAYKRATGIPAEHVIGKQAGNEGTAGALIPGWADNIRLVFETGEPIRVPLTYPLTAGELGHFEALLVPELGSEGSIASVLATTRM